MEVSQFQDLLFGGKITRRQAKQLMATFGVGSLTLPMAGAGRALAEPEDNPLFFTWVGYDSPEFVQHYIDKYGEEPRYTFFASEDEAFNKMRGGFTPDLTYPCGSVLKLWYDAGLLAPIDTDMLSNWPDVMDIFKQAPNSVVDGNRVYVPEDWGQTSIIVRTDLAPEYADPANQTWAALWDEKYAGKIAIADYYTDDFAVAALLLGYDPWDLDEEKMQACADLLREQLPLNRMLTESNTELTQALVSGELVMAMGWNSTLLSMVEATDGMDTEWTWMNPKEGAMTWHCGLCIHPVALKDGMYEKCHEIINSFISPEAGEFEIENWYYGHTNRKAYEKFDEAFLRSIGLAKDLDKFFEETVFVQEMNHTEQIAIMWEEVKAGF
jgi:spermidine/putrescine transport system substrate-binding protein